MKSKYEGMNTETILRVKIFFFETGNNRQMLAIIAAKGKQLGDLVPCKLSSIADKSNFTRKKRVSEIISQKLKISSSSGKGTRRKSNYRHL